MPKPITHENLLSSLHSPRPPLVIDVRRPSAYLAGTDTLRGALRRDPEAVSTWAEQLPRSTQVVVYCAHGREVSQRVAAELELCGREASYLEGGLEAGWKERGGALDEKPAGAPSRWVTRARPKIERIACPWLIARFIDSAAEFLYVPAEQVLAVARERSATPYDVPAVAVSHAGERCSFDALLERYHLQDPALLELATIVRGADTGELDLAPQAPGLLALSLGLSRLFHDDHEMLRHGLVLYDALHAWCREGKDEIHTWNPAAYRGPERS
ncbi:MAG: sulfurtransferase [Planctomycetes bacterium]|nr:sulfurtransferase [Planctomycetota bacterium]